jgi:glycosyltransferase involved in cell wall biosynthesis
MSEIFQKLRVVHLTSVHRPDDIRIFQKQAKSLASYGHDVHLIATSLNPDMVVLDGVTILFVKKQKTKKARLTITCPTIFFLALRMNADIYHAHDPELIPWCFLLKLLRRKVVVDLHENYQDQVTGMHWIPIFLRPVFSVMVAAIIRVAVWLFDGVVVADDQLKAKYTRIAKFKRLALIRNYPVISHPFVLTIPVLERYERAIILFLGGISHGRVVEEFISAIDLIMDIPFQVILCGDCNDAILLDRLKKHSSWSRVLFKGRIPMIEIEALMLSSSISINLYANAPNNYQIRSNRLFEAMAAGLPVICSNFPAWSNFIEKNNCGYIADPHSPKSIARALQEALLSPAEMMRRGHNGRNEAIKNYSWESEFTQLIGLYNQIIDKK